MEKKSGSGGLSSCPYCEEFLELKEQEFIDGFIYEVYKCLECGREFEVKFEPTGWKEL